MRERGEERSGRLIDNIFPKHHLAKMGILMQNQNDFSHIELMILRRKKLTLLCHTGRVAVYTFSFSGLSQWSLTKIMSSLNFVCLLKQLE